MPRKTGLFASARFRSADREGPFVSLVSDRACTVDNPDGAFVDCYGLGPYAVGGDRGRVFSEGAGTERGNGGTMSGKGKTITLKGD